MMIAGIQGTVDMPASRYQSKWYLSRAFIVLAILVPLIAGFIIGEALQFQNAHVSKLRTISAVLQKDAEQLQDRMAEIATISEFCAKTPALSFHFQTHAQGWECVRLAKQANLWVVVVELGETHTHIVNSTIPFGEKLPKYPRTAEIPQLIEVETRSRNNAAPALSSVFPSLTMERLDVVTFGQYVALRSGREVMVYVGTSTSSLGRDLTTKISGDPVEIFCLDDQGMVVAENIRGAAQQSAALVHEIHAPNWMDDIGHSHKLIAQSDPIGQRRWRGYVVADMPSYFDSANHTTGFQFLLMATIVSLIVAAIMIRIRLADAAAFEAGIEAKEIAKQNREQARMISQIAHELRSPLVNLLGALALRGDGDGDESGRDRDRAPTGIVEGLLHQLDDLLEFAYVKSGEIRLSPTTIDIRDSIARVVDEYSIAASQKDITVSLFVDPLVPRFVVVDRVRLKQCLRNLISNAIKYTVDGQVKINVWRSGVGRRGSVIQFSVSDTGIGIATEDLPMIFTDFGRLRAAGTAGEKSIGLGLTITRRILDALGSELRVTSQVGKGSTFTFALELPEANGSAATSGQSDILSGLSVLLVEDEPIIRSLTKTNLAKAGAQVVTAENGRQALDAIGITDPDLILLDMEMPEYDGEWFLEQVKENGIVRGVPIFLLTSHAFGDRVERARRLGITDVFTKPVQISALVAAFHAQRGASGNSTPHLAVKPRGPMRKLINEEHCREIFDAVGERLFSKFFPDLETDIEQGRQDARRLVQNGDFEEARKLAHRMKGLCMTLGLEKLSDVLEGLETATSDKNEEKCQALFEELDRIAPEIPGAIRHLQTTLMP